MKKKTIEKMNVPKKIRRKKWWITTDTLDDILILNIYHDGGLFSRHCINKDTHEYATLIEGEGWSDSRIEHALGFEKEDYMYNGYYRYYRSNEYSKETLGRFQMSNETQNLIRQVLSVKEDRTLLYEILIIEQSYMSDELQRRNDSC